MTTYNKNEITIIGNLGSDPRITDLKNGKQMISFSVAVHYQETTDWFDVVVFNKDLQSSIKDTFKKGLNVTITGRAKPKLFNERLSIEVFAYEASLTKDEESK